MIPVSRCLLLSNMERWFIKQLATQKQLWSPTKRKVNPTQKPLIRDIETCGIFGFKAQKKKILQFLPRKFGVLILDQVLGSVVFEHLTIER